MGKYEELLVGLAQQMGTTSEYLWEVLLRQAPINATITLVQMVVLAVAIFVFCKVHVRFSKKDEKGWTTYDDSDMWTVVMWTIGLLLAGLVVAAIFSLETVFNGYFNPEYWALSKILETMK